MDLVILAKQIYYCICFMSCWSLIKSTSSQKTCTRINISLVCRTLLNESTPRLVMRLSRLMVMKSFHSKSFRWTTKKLLFLMILFVKATKTASLIILSTGGTETAGLFTSLKPSTRCRKTSVITAAIFVFQISSKRKQADCRRDRCGS